MCLVTAAWNCRDDLVLVIAANRDELHERPASALQWWATPADILGGRDDAAGGTWFAVARDGRFGVITNFRETPVTKSDRSRGELIVDFLTGGKSPEQFASVLVQRAPQYAGFNLLYGDTRSLRFFSNRHSGDRSLDQGVYGLSNGRLDNQWEKVGRSKSAMQHWLQHNSPSTETLFDALADRRPSKPDDPSRQGLAEALSEAASAPFINNPHYGTRCSTVLTLTARGKIDMHERRFDRHGICSGNTTISFSLGPQRQTA